MPVKGLCSVEQAACTALQDFLKAQFNEVYPQDLPPDQRVQVLDRWPEAGVDLPPLAVSVIMAGERQDTHVTPELVKRSPTADPNTDEFTWTVKAFRQPIQLDVWANYDSKRDELLYHMDRFLNMGPRYTLDQPLNDVTRDGPLLPLDPASGHEGNVDFTFEGPRRVTDDGAVRANEFRALIRGDVDGDLCFTAKTAKLVLVKLKLALEGSPANFTLEKNQAGDGFEITSAEL